MEKEDYQNRSINPKSEDNLNQQPFQTNTNENQQLSEYQIKESEEQHNDKQEEE